MNIVSFARNASWFSLGISVAVVLLFGAVMVQGSTTISTNISTGGTLAVTGAATLSSTLAVSDVSSLTGLISSASSTVNGAWTAVGAVRNLSTVNTSGAVAASSTLQVTGDVTAYGGSGALNLVTTNTATSSATVGCVQMYATSTSQPVRLVFYSTSTQAIGVTSTFNTLGTNLSASPTQVGGYVLFEFGTCP